MTPRHRRRRLATPAPALPLGGTAGPRGGRSRPPPALPAAGVALSPAMSVTRRALPPQPGNRAAPGTRSAGSGFPLLRLVRSSLLRTRGAGKPAVRLTPKAARKERQEEERVPLPWCSGQNPARSLSPRATEVSPGPAGCGAAGSASRAPRSAGSSQFLGANGRTAKIRRQRAGLRSFSN